MMVRRLGRCDFAETVRAMQAFTAARGPDTGDELWLCEHEPVFSQGLAGRAEHVRHPGAVPVVQTDRGGQVTYHGPGQVVAYPLVDLRALGVYVKEYVYRLEQALLKTLESYAVTGHRVPGAPGIYVRPDDPHGHARWVPPPPGAADPFAGLAKVAALGIKVRRHDAYHGVALNVAMDLAPFGSIDPCGYPGLETTDLATLGVDTDWNSAAERLAAKLVVHLSR